MTTPTHILIALPLDRISLAHLVASGVAKAEALVNYLSPALLAETCDAVAELHRHHPDQLHQYFIAYLAEHACVSVGSQDPVPAPLFNAPIAPGGQDRPGAAKATPRRRRAVSLET
jgi:hypothetical protein